jgi:hypothetical protein
VNQILLAIGQRPDCRVWANETGAAYRDEKLIHYGRVGSSDILGLTSDGKILCVEVKTGKASLSKYQVHFQNMILKFGGRFFLARDVDSIVKFLDDLALTSA